MPDDLLPSWRPGRHPRRDRGVPRRRRDRAGRASGWPASTTTARCGASARPTCSSTSSSTRCRARSGRDPSVAEQAGVRGAAGRRPRRDRRRSGLERIALRADRPVRRASRPRSSPPRSASSWPGAQHPTLGRPLRSHAYLPMLELIDELRRRDFTVGIVTGGGTEFVRAVSQRAVRRAARGGGRDADRLRVRPRRDGGAPRCAGPAAWSARPTRAPPR